MNELTTLNDAEENIRMRVKSDGTVLWEPGGAFIVKCALDITNFPFDRQECTLSKTFFVVMPFKLHTIQCNINKGYGIAIVALAKT